jgi:hypothetical protein
MIAYETGTLILIGAAIMIVIAVGAVIAFLRIK